MKSHLSPVLFIAFLFSAPTVTYAGFEEIVIEAKPSGGYALGLVVTDQRKHVFQSGKKSNFLGAQISGMFRGRNDLFTDSDGPMAKEIEAGITNFFNKSTQRAIAAIPTQEASSKGNIIEALKRAAIQRTLLVEIKNFWVESANRSATVSYDITVSVADSNGIEIAKTDIDGVQTAGQYSTYGANEVFGTIMSQALNNPAIAEAIR